MYIKKIQQPANYPDNSIFDGYNESMTDTYSCNYLNTQKVLWGPGGFYMHATQTITLSEPISKQKNGIVLVWTNYENGTAQNNGINYFFIPKKYVELHPGMGHGMLMIKGWDGNIGKKYVYISDTQISGYAKNGQEITENGIKWVNNNYVLRYVLGV